VNTQRETDLLGKAWRLYQEGRRQDAMRVVSTLLRANPRSEQGWLLMAKLVGDDEEKVVYSLRKALLINPANQEVRQALERREKGRGKVTSSGNRNEEPLYKAEEHTPLSRKTTFSHDSSDVIAMILEIIFGIFGALGMGWLYAGRILMAIGVFVGFLIIVLFEIFLVTSTRSLGIAVCFSPINLAIVVVSGIRARDYVRNTSARGSIVRVVLAMVMLGGVVLGVSFLVYLLMVTPARGSGAGW